MGGKDVIENDNPVVAAQNRANNPQSGILTLRIGNLKVKSESNIGFGDETRLIDLHKPGVLE